MDVHQATWQLILNFLAVHIVAWMRKSKNPKLNWIGMDAPEWTTHAVMLGLSFFTAIGLVWHYQPGTGQFAISGSITGLGVGLQHILQNYVGVTGLYWFHNIQSAAQIMIKDYLNRPNTTVVLNPAVLQPAQKPS